MMAEKASDTVAGKSASSAKAATENSMEAVSHMDVDSEPTEQKSMRIVIMNLTIYKVQQGIYLLDFHTVKGELFSFIGLCSNIINELKLHAARMQLQKHLVNAK